MAAPIQIRDLSKVYDAEHTELADGRTFVLKASHSYQVADGAEPHRSRTSTGAKLFIVD